MSKSLINKLQKLVVSRLDSIDSKKKSFFKRVSRLEKDLFDMTLQDFLGQLDIKDGFIINSTDNIERITRSGIVSTFMYGKGKGLVDLLLRYFLDISDAVGGYYDNFSIKDFNKIKDIVSNKILLKLGYNGEKYLKGGYLYSLYTDNSIERRIKAFATAAVESGMSRTAFKKSLGFLVRGNNSLGAFTSFVSTHVNDTFSQFDRSLNLAYAQQLELTYAMYTGNKMSTSRDFCKKRMGKVFTSEEIDKWNKLKWVGKIKGSRVQVSLGGYNCGHVLSFITKELAEILRPDLRIVA